MAGLQKLSVNSLRGRARKLKRQSPGMDAAVNTTFALLFAWPVVHYMALGEGLLMALGVGVGGTIAMLFGGAILSAMLEEIFSRKNLDAFGWLGISAAASSYWWASYPTVWAPVVLMLLAFGVFALSFRSTRDAVAADPELRGLPPALALDIAAQPKKLPSALKQRLDDALADYTDLHEMLRAEGGLAGDAAIDADAILRDAAATIREINTRVGTLRRLERIAAGRESERVQSTLQTARAQLDALQSSLHEATEAVLVYAAAAGSADSDALREQTEKLRLVTSGMNELDAMLAAGED